MMPKLARLYDTWPSHKQANYNPDGSMKEEYRQALLADGWAMSVIRDLEERTKMKVQAFDDTERIYYEDYGIGYTEYCLRALKRERRSKPDSKERQRKALASGEELSSLPDYIEPDEYYDYYSGGDDDDY